MTTDNYGRSLEYRIDLCVKVLRLKYSLSQTQLAKRMHRPRTYVGKIERRMIDPTFRNVRLIARAFQMSPRRFMELATVKA